ncbi:MAG TPA: hypothetical protein VFI38_10805 [Candidatus Acidoferrum sp.]|nr:hypothetical protein [Candidatus Acidoferrum sp.]
MALSLSKISWSFLAVGFFAPCTLQCLFYFKILPIERMPDWLFVALWPGFGFFMASDTGNGLDAGKAILGFILSVAANALVYLLVGSLVSFSYRRLLLGRLGAGG